MTHSVPRYRFSATPLRSHFGAVVEGLSISELSDKEVAEVALSLMPAWQKHLVLFFPGAHLTPRDQVRFARCFGTRVAATTELPGDYSNAPTLAHEGYPEILVLDTGSGRYDPKHTAAWHADVSFTECPPIGALFVVEMASETGGDTIWSNQIAAHASLSEPIQAAIADLQAVHGRPPLTPTWVHPVVITHYATGERSLYINRAWCSSIKGLSSIESAHLLAILCETSERPEMQLRWRWHSGDAVLWDNRYTNHYAVNDYGGQRRRVRRATLYDR